MRIVDICSLVIPASLQERVGAEPPQRHPLAQGRWLSCQPSVSNWRWTSFGISLLFRRRRCALWRSCPSQYSAGPSGFPNLARCLLRPCTTLPAGALSQENQQKIPCKEPRALGVAEPELCRCFSTPFVIAKIRSGKRSAAYPAELGLRAAEIVIARCQHGKCSLTSNPDAIAAQSNVSTGHHFY